MSIPELRADPTTGIIYLHWTEPGPKGQRGRSRRKSTGTKLMAAAQAYLGEWLLLGGSTPASERAYTVGELWAQYRDKHVPVKCTAHQTFDYSWKNLSVLFGDKLVQQVNQELVETYERRRSKGTIGRPSKPPTIRRELVALRACLNWAANPRRRLIPLSEVPHFDLPPNGAPKDRWLRTEEIAALFSAAASLNKRGRLSPIELFLWLGLETGARKTAILELTWDRVDFEIGVVHYNVPGRVKTKKRRASVAMSPSLRPVLERAYSERSGDLVVGLKDNVWRTLQVVAKKAGLKGVSPHVLRHTAATIMARNGVPLHQVAGVLANSIQMVDRVYAHHSPDSHRDAVAKISGGLFQAPSDFALLQAIRSGKLKVVEAHE